MVDAILLRAEARLAQGDLDACAQELERVPGAGIGLVTNGLGLLSKGCTSYMCGPNLLIGAKITLHLLRLWKKPAASA